VGIKQHCYNIKLQLYHFSVLWQKKDDIVSRGLRWHLPSCHKSQAAWLY